MHIFCFKDVFSDLPFSCAIVIVCTGGQWECAVRAREGCRTALLATCHSCLCNHESTASSETPSQMAQKAVPPPQCKSRCQQGIPTPTTPSWSLQCRSSAPTVQRGRQSWNSSLSLTNACSQLWTVVAALTNIPGWCFKSRPGERRDSGNSRSRMTLDILSQAVTHFPEGRKLLVQTSANLQLQKILPALLSCPTFFSLLLPATTTCGEAELQEQTQRHQVLATSRCRSTQLEEKTRSYKGQKLSDEVPSNISKFNVIYDS